jgi:dolichol-phosphate mannosyltransferase
VNLRVWVVVPTYNEAENIGEIIPSILSNLPNSFIVVVDDNSNDGTFEIVEGIRKVDGRVHIVRRQRKLGYASAVITGLIYAISMGAEFIGHMDADFSHDPKSLPDLFKELEKGADMVIGSRYIPGGRFESSIRRKILSVTANFLVRKLLSLPIRDCTSGFRFYRKDAIEKLPLRELKVKGNSFLFLCTAFAFWNNLKISEVPIFFVERKRGRSKLSHREVIEAFLCLIKIFIWKKTGRWLGASLLGQEGKDIGRPTH